MKYSACQILSPDLGMLGYLLFTILLLTQNKNSADDFSIRFSPNAMLGKRKLRK